MFKDSSKADDGIYSVEQHAFPNGSVKRDQETTMTHMPHHKVYSGKRSDWKFLQTWDSQSSEVANTAGGQVSFFLTNPESHFRKHRQMRGDASQSKSQKEINKKFKLNDPEVGISLFM